VGAAALPRLPELRPSRAVDEHFHTVEPEQLTPTLVGAERVWRAIESGLVYPASSPSWKKVSDDFFHGQLAESF
jgi:hypothetical protein